MKKKEESGRITTLQYRGRASEPEPRNLSWHANLFSVMLLLVKGKSCSLHKEKGRSMNPELRRRTDEVVSRLSQLRDSL